MERRENLYGSRQGSRIPLSQYFLIVFFVRCSSLHPNLETPSFHRSTPLPEPLFRYSKAFAGRPTPEAATFGKISGEISLSPLEIPQGFLRWLDSTVVLGIVRAGRLLQQTVSQIDMYEHRN